MLDNNITAVVHGGDIVDRRKYINYNTAQRLRKDFLDPISNMGVDFHIIAGNHDIHLKETNQINAIDELIAGRYPSFHTYQNHAAEVMFDGTKILMMPWICEDNKKQIFNKIQNTDAKIGIGHLELAGFELFRGSLPSHGEDRNIFSKFKMVMSGHFHHRSTDGQIFYLGSHMEFTWSDFDDPRGFHVFDTETNKLTFIPNPYIMFRKYFYNDVDEKPNLSKIDFSKYKDSILKIIVKGKNDHNLYDKFIEKLEAHNPVEIQVVYDNASSEVVLTEDTIDDTESTVDIMKKHIMTYETSVDKNKLEHHLIDLYNEAQSIS